MTAGPATAPAATLSRRRVDAGIGVQCEGVRHVYVTDGGEVVAVDDVYLEVAPGESLALLGPSGSGKSTMMSLLAGLLRPTAGRLLIGGDDVARMSERDLLAVRADRIGVVVQNAGRNLLPYGTAVDNIRFAQRGVSGFRRSELPAPLELLDRLQLAHLARRRVLGLSGGEQQRLAVAVALANAPGLLLADEPTSQLDLPNRDAVVELLATVSTRFGTTVIAVTHDPAVGVALGRMVRMSEGRLDLDGQVREQYVTVRADGSVALPEDVRRTLPPGTSARLVRKPNGIELVREPDAGAAPAAGR